MPRVFCRSIRNPTLSLSRTFWSSTRGRPRTTPTSTTIWGGSTSPSQTAPTGRFATTCKTCRNCTMTRCPVRRSIPAMESQRAVLNQNLVVTFTHRFSDQFSNVLRGGFTRFQVTETPQDANFDPAKVGLPSGPLPTYLLSGLDPQYAGASPSGNGAFGGWFDSVWFPSFRACP